MFVCKMTQSVKYVQFKGQPIELINGYKYANKDIIAMYPSYFVEIKEDSKTDAIAVIDKLEVAEPEIVEEVVKVEETVETTLTEVVVTARKKGGRPPKVLVDDSSDVKIESSED